MAPTAQDTVSSFELPLGNTLAGTILHCALVKARQTVVLGSLVTSGVECAADVV